MFSLQLQVSPCVKFKLFINIWQDFENYACGQIFAKFDSSRTYEPLNSNSLQITKFLQNYECSKIRNIPKMSSVIMAKLNSFE